MAKKKKKASEELAIPTDALESSSQDDSNMKSVEVSILSDHETQLWRAFGDYKSPYQNGEEPRGRHWTFIVYEDSAPKNWIELLEATGLAFAVSPYHDSDVNPDGSPKKAHWHVLVSYSNTTTYSAIVGLREITKGPYPQQCKSVSGLYAYFTHKHNPEKFQYNAEDITRHNGWEKVLEANEVSALMRELTIFCLLNDVQEYAELLIEVMTMGGDYESVAMSHTVYFDRLITSYRHAPLRVLHRYYNTADEDTQKLILEQIQLIERTLEAC